MRRKHEQWIHSFSNKIYLFVREFLNSLISILAHRYSKYTKHENCCLIHARRKFNKFCVFCKKTRVIFLTFITKSGNAVHV